MKAFFGQAFLLSLDMAHKLKTLVRDSALDANLLIVTDISQYDDRLEILNHTRYIQLPGFDDAIKVPFTIGETNAYNSRHLQQCGLNEPLQVLPDGLYTITTSVAPNTKVFTVNYHYRTARIEIDIYTQLAKLRNCPDVHDVDDCGNMIIQKQESILLRCLLLLESLKADFNLYTDYANAAANYTEIEKMLAAFKTNC